MSMVSLEKILIGVVVLVLTVSSAFALEAVKVVPHHRGVQSSNFHINMKSTTASSLGRHRGLQQLKGELCEKESILIIEQNERSQPRRGFQQASI